MIETEARCLGDAAAAIGGAVEGELVPAPLSSLGRRLDASGDTRSAPLQMVSTHRDGPDRQRVADRATK